MSTNSIDSTTSSDPTASSNTTTPTRSTTLGQDEFMQLLVTQLQNQDPTQPQDNGQFIAQLATFSSLEQLQSMNKTLTQIANFFGDVQSSSTTTATDNTGATGAS